MHPNLQTFCGIKVKNTYRQGIFIDFLTHCLRKKKRNIQFSQKMYLLIHILFQGMWERRICRTSVPSDRTDFCLTTWHSANLHRGCLVIGWTEHIPYSPSLAPTDTPLYATLRYTDADIYTSLLQRGQSALLLPIQARVPWRSSNDKTAHGSTTHWLRPDTPSFGITVSPLIYSHKWNVWVETSTQSHPKLSPDRKAKGRASSAHCMTKAKQTAKSRRYAE